MSLINSHQKTAKYKTGNTKYKKYVQTKSKAKASQKTTGLPACFIAVRKINQQQTANSPQIPAAKVIQPYV
jgi:hypothetical protein